MTLRQQLVMIMELFLTIAKNASNKTVIGVTFPTARSGYTIGNTLNVAILVFTLKDNELAGKTLSDTTKPY